MTVYTTTETQASVTLCAIVTSHPGGAPRTFTISATTRDGTAGTVWNTNVSVGLSHSLQLITTVAGSDYVAVFGEQLVFAEGATRVCHTIDILQDEMCEYPPNEFFFSDLAYVSGLLPITISPETAQVVIDDSSEAECSKYSISQLGMCERSTGHI